MIITVAEVKEILLISDSTYDASIAALIPYVQDDIVEYLNNCFPDRQTRYNAATIVYNESSSRPSITDTQENFIDYGFSTSMDIAVEGTDRNSGIYSVYGLAAGTITLTTNDTLYNESSTEFYGGGDTRITRVRWPKGIKIQVAQIIWENISRVKTKDIKSKRIGPSSVTYMPIESGGYSEHIIRGLAKYRKAKMN